MSIVEPLRDRSARDVGGNRRVPSLFGGLVASAQRLELARQAIPPAAAGAFDETGAALRVGPDVAEAAAENPREFEAERCDELPDRVLLFVDHVAARFRVLAVHEAVADCPHASPDAFTRVDDGDVGAHRHQLVGRGQTGETGARDEHGRPGEIL